MIPETCCCGRTEAGRRRTCSKCLLHRVPGGRSRRRRCQDLKVGAPQREDVWVVFFCCFFARSLPRSHVCVLLFRSCCIFSARKSNPSTLKQQKHLQTFTTLKSPKSYKKNVYTPIYTALFPGFLIVRCPC